MGLLLVPPHLVYSGFMMGPDQTSLPFYTFHDFLFLAEFLFDACCCHYGNGTISFPGAELLLVSKVIILGTLFQLLIPEHFKNLNRLYFPMKAK